MADIGQKGNQQALLSEKMTVLVCSCDAYADLWTPFFTLLHKNWPGLPCRVVLNTETKAYAAGPIPVTALHPADPQAPYGLRMQEALSKIDTPYTLLLLDDFFLRAPVDEARLADIVRWMDAEPDIASVNFDPNNPRTEEMGAVPGFYRMPQCAMYKLNMQAGVWRTQRLLHYWRADDDPWRWELFVNYLTFKSKDVFYEVGSTATSPVLYGLNKAAAWGVVGGKWAIEDVRPLFLGNGLDIDFSARGGCAPTDSPKRMPLSVSTVRYMLSRIGARYTVGLVLFTAIKKCRRKLGLPLRYEFYPEKLSARHG